MGKASDGAAKSATNALSAKDEAKEVAQAKAKAGELKAGDVCYVVASTWFRAWEAYCESEEGKPEQIDNTSILELPETQAKATTNGEMDDFLIQLKPGLVPGEDYTLLSEAEWSLLSKWYAPQIPLLLAVGYLFRANLGLLTCLKGVISRQKICTALGAFSHSFLPFPIPHFLQIASFYSRNPLTTLPDPQSAGMAAVRS